MKPLTLGVVEVVSGVDDGELNLAAVGKVHGLIDNEPAGLNTAFEREGHGTKLPPGPGGRHPLATPLLPPGCSSWRTTPTPATRS